MGKRWGIVARLEFTMVLMALTVCTGIPCGGAERAPRAVKNVIFMVSDGTSLPVLSLARWYQRYLIPDSMHLTIDPFICGTVITHSSNAPIGDSAPTMSCYMTGVPSITGFIGTHPYSDGEDDLVPLDTAWAYRPLLSLMEAARLETNRRTGVVVTCQYPHATPANCAAHYPDRKAYGILGQQMVHNGLDVVIGGGTKYLRPEDKEYLEAQGYACYMNDLSGLRNAPDGKVWALFGSKALPMDLDRDTSSVPSLAESTRIAIEHLDGSEQGFFLMVEGSQVDWAAHDNDPVGVATEFLAFDRACQVALDFARRDGNTAVVITADHGNSGISIGRESWPRYDEYSAKELFSQLVRFKRSAAGMASVVRNTPPEQLDSLFMADCGFTLSEDERARLYTMKSYRQSPLSDSVRRKQPHSLYGSSMSDFVADVYTARTPIAFTTHGHTGEDVFLGAYHPDGDVPRGVHFNVELHRYLASLLGFPEGLVALRDKYYAPHAEVFAGQKVRLEQPDGAAYPTLVVRHKGRELRVEAYSNRVLIDGAERRLGSVAVYIPQRSSFYLSRSLSEWWR